MNANASTGASMPDNPPNRVRNDLCGLPKISHLSLEMVQVNVLRFFVSRNNSSMHCSDWSDWALLAARLYIDLAKSSR